MTRYFVLDTIQSDPCPVCGCKYWIIDGDGDEKDPRYWLLCEGMNGACVKTKPIPENIEIIEIIERD